MANMIKNALIKQLSKYLKNVSANQINISTFKGEGEMKNIELDEHVIMSLIELPTWIKITNATCNRANFKIQWTKLKTQPICIYLEKITLVMETTEELREFKTKDDVFKELAGSYGFIDKCIDGMYLTIDSISISLKSKTFNAKLDLTNIYVYSTTPNWQTCQDIRLTRIKDLENGEIIMFKEISWETSRIEAYSIDTTNHEIIGSPIKLIMNQSKAQITLKKRLADKSMVASTLKLLLNDIYWMANDTQLKAGLVAYSAIQKLMKKAFKQKAKLALYKLQEEAKMPAKSTEPLKQTAAKSAADTNASKVFRQFDILETSLHLQASTLNLHLFCDENFSGNKLLDGGTIQLLFKKLCIDHYPYHKVGTPITHWNNYNHVFMQKQDFSKRLLISFTEELMHALRSSSINASHATKITHVNLLEACTVVTMKDCSVYTVTTNLTNSHRTRTKMFHTSEPQPLPSAPDSTKFTPNLLLKTMNEKFIESNFGEFNLPPDTVLINVFLSEFYFPEEFNYPLPNIQLYSQIAPIKLNVDYLTLLWLNTLVLALSTEIVPLINELNAASVPSSPGIQLVDACVECILPKLCLKLYNEAACDTNIPKYISILCSSLKLTNLCVDQETDLKSLCKKVYKKSNLCMSHEKWPFEPTDLSMLPSCLLDIYNDMQLNDSEPLKQEQVVTPKNGLLLSKLNKKTFKPKKISSADLWLVSVENLWVDINASQTSKVSTQGANHENTIVMPTSLKLWAVNTNGYYASKSDKKKSEHEQPCLRFGELLSESKRSFDCLDVSLAMRKRQARTNGRRRSKSLACCKRNTAATMLFKGKHVYNTKLNLVCDLKEAKVKINHQQFIFLLRLMDEVSFFQKQLEHDSSAVVSSLSKAQETKSNKISLSASAAVFLDKLELVCTITDRRRCKNEFPEEFKAMSLDNSMASEHQRSIELPRTDPAEATSAQMIPPEKPSTPLSSTQAPTPRRNTATTSSSDDCLDEFVVIPDFKRSQRVMTKNETDINLLILHEHIQQIYGVLDNSKYMHQTPVVVSPQQQQPTLPQQQTSLFSISNQMPAVVTPAAKSKLQQHRNSNDSSIFSSFTTKSASQILELSVTSLKNNSDNGRGKSTFGFLNNFGMGNKSANDSDSMLDVDMDDDSDTESICINTISSSIDNKVFFSNDTSLNQIASEPALNKEPSVVTTDSSNDQLSQSVPTSPEHASQLACNTCEIIVKLNDVQACVQLKGEDMTLLARLLYIDVQDGNQFLKDISDEQRKSGAIHARYSKGPLASRKQCGANLSGFFELRIVNEFFFLNNSTLNGILELIEDDAAETSIPLSILVENCKINLSSDMANENTKNRKKLGFPLNALIQKLLINRSSNGEMVLSGGLVKRHQPVNKYEERVKRLIEENEQLRIQLNEKNERLSTLESDISKQFLQ